MASTLIQPLIVKHYTVYGHPVTVDCERGHGEDNPDPKTIQCPECGLSFVTTQCILLMARLNVRKMTVDGCEIVFTHVTAKTDS